MSILSVFTDMGLLDDSQSPADTGEYLLRHFNIPRNGGKSFLIMEGFISLSAYSFQGSEGTPFDVISPKNGVLVYLKWQLSLFNFSFPFLHTCTSGQIITSSSWPFSSYSTIGMSSAMPNTCSISSNILSIFHWNVSPAGAVLNFNLAHMCLLNGQAN